MELSVVVPVFKSELTLASVVEATVSALQEIPSFEIILVNDASPDGSDRVGRELVKKFSPRVRYFLLAANVGEHGAVFAGLRQARGRYTVMIDDDGQNPPEEILSLLEAARAHSYDVVYGRYRQKRHSFFRNALSRLNGKLAEAFLKKPKNLYLSSFKLMERSVVERVVSYDGNAPYIDALVLRAGRNIGQAIVEHKPRLQGRSTYDLEKLFSLWMKAASFYFPQLERVLVKRGPAYVIKEACQPADAS